ncbi:dimer_Tnp_hAT domain-containing protein [Trichonephila clavipes]|nr:dimer_Tnp_hAT domain-containing protein [Trichonephila clavipes]
MEDKEASNSKGTPTKKARRVCHYNVDWESPYDSLKAVTHHAEAKKRKECESAAAMSHRMKSFFTPKGSAQSEKVGIAELTEVYHSIKHHISYVAHDCSLKVLKQVINDSDIVKQMTGGRTKCTALVNQGLFPYSMELVQEDLKNDVPFSVANDASNKDSFEDSISIKERLCEVMDKSRLPWSRVTAYGADNASVNFGVNNPVFQKLKSEENNDIIDAHCNDHIFHNCAKNALKVMPVDVENIVMKVFTEFSCSAKKREDLKECFDFFESEYREVIRHVPTRWLSLFKALDRMLSPWGPLKRYFIERGSDNCPTALWAILSDQENEISVHVALKKGYLPDHEVEKFTKNATNAYHRALAYIEKWYPFENQNYKTFSCLNLECGRLPTLELLSISPWKQQTPPEQIYDELAALLSVFPSLKLEGNSIEMWCNFFQKEEAPNLLKIVQFVCSVPVSNAFVERIFSVMGNVWTDERNRVAVNTVKSELCIFFNISSNCTEFKDAISTNKPLLKAV